MSTSPMLMPASFRQYWMASCGKALVCFSVPKRSSAAAATMRPSARIAAALSRPWTMRSSRGASRGRASVFSKFFWIDRPMRYGQARLRIE